MKYYDAMQKAGSGPFEELSVSGRRLKEKVSMGGVDLVIFGTQPLVDIFPVEIRRKYAEFVFFFFSLVSLFACFNYETFV